MAMTTMYNGVPPTNNSLWVGNNYSTMPRNNYPTMNQQNATMSMPIFTNQPQSINNVLQVMGPESAQSYQVGPDSHVILMDSNRPVFYVKRSDSTGYAETHAFQFNEIPLFDPPIQSKAKVEDTQINNQEYVTKSDFEDFKKMIEDLVMKNE